MSKYIDADKLKDEIEKRLKNVRDYMNGAGMRYKGPKYFKAQGKESAYDALLNTITSLQQEQPELDFEKEVDNFLNETGAPYVWCNDDEQKEWCSIIAHHFWNKGYITGKEE